MHTTITMRFYLVGAMLLAAFALALAWGSGDSSTPALANHIMPCADTDGDGRVGDGDSDASNDPDYEIIYEFYGSSNPPGNADTNGDGRITVADIVAFSNNYGDVDDCQHHWNGYSCPWDTTNDGYVRIADLIAVINHVDETVPPGNADYDVDRDGTITEGDVYVVQGHYGENC